MWTSLDHATEASRWLDEGKHFSSGPIGAGCLGILTYCHLSGDLFLYILEPVMAGAWQIPEMFLWHLSCCPNVKYVVSFCGTNLFSRHPFLAATSHSFLSQPNCKIFRPSVLFFAPSPYIWIKASSNTHTIA
jgi:hypothetical protein